MNQKIMLLISALALSACAHETTTMDRELALMLADRQEVQIVQAPVQPAPNFNINFNNGGGAAGPSAANDGWVGPRFGDGTPDKRVDCMKTPVKDSFGNVVSYERECFGSH